MAWSRRYEILSVAGVQATEKFSSGVILDPTEKVHLMVRATLGGGTDNLVVNVYSNIDPKTKSGTAVSIAAGGTNYTVGDVLTMSGGVKATAATVRVLTLGGSDAVASIELVEEGDYTQTPADPITTTGGTGTGCTLNGDWDGDNWDTTPVETQTITTAGAGVQIISIVLQGYQRFRVGVVGGATDSHAALGWIRTYSAAL